MTPDFPKPWFGAKFHLGMVMALIFYFSQNGTWPWDMANLDQEWGPTWTRDGAQPGPGTGLSLAPAQGLQGISILGRGWPTPSSEKEKLGNVFFF